MVNFRARNFEFCLFSFLVTSDSISKVASSHRKGPKRDPVYEQSVYLLKTGRDLPPHLACRCHGSLASLQGSCLMDGGLIPLPDLWQENSVHALAELARNRVWTQPCSGKQILQSDLVHFLLVLALLSTVASLAGRHCCSCPPSLHPYRRGPTVGPRASALPPQPILPADACVTALGMGPQKHL